MYMDSRCFSVSFNFYLKTEKRTWHLQSLSIEPKEFKSETCQIDSSLPGSDATYTVHNKLKNQVNYRFDMNSLPSKSQIYTLKVQCSNFVPICQMCFAVFRWKSKLTGKKEGIHNTYKIHFVSFWFGAVKNRLNKILLDFKDWLV